MRKTNAGWLTYLSYRAPAEIIPVGITPPASESVRKAWSTDLSDHTRFEELVLPHLNAAYNLARWLTRDVNDAEDVVQDACVRALKYVDSLNGGGARAWFLTIVRHAFYDWCKRNRPTEIARDDGTAIDMAIDPAAVDPEQALLRGAESKALADAVAALPLAYREVLILREMEELSYKEIARIADIPIGTVMSRLARARGLLQRSPLLQAAN
jgi:RNA polymerase sigma-70 factor (ECF subfamily)